MWQEGVVATGLVCALVLFELFYVSALPDDKCSGDGRSGDGSSGSGDGGGAGDDDESQRRCLGEKFYWSTGVSAFFLLEILLRYHVWRHTVQFVGRDTRAMPDNISSSSSNSSNLTTTKEEGEGGGEVSMGASSSRSSSSSSVVGGSNGVGVGSSIDHSHPHYQAVREMNCHTFLKHTHA
jgi:hypothetical protein